MNVCIGANKEKNPLIRCTLCHLYFHFRCIFLHPSVYVPNFTCSRCKLAAARRRNILQPAIGHHSDHVTTETNSANCDSGDVELLRDFFDSNAQPALGNTGKTKYDDVEGDDIEADDDEVDDDCIMID